MRNHGDQQRRRREGLSRFDANDGGDGRDLEAPPGFAEVLLDAATSSPPEMCSATRPGANRTKSGIRSTLAGFKPVYPRQPRYIIAFY
jgi:hypothetical protein